MVTRPNAWLTNEATTMKQHRFLIIWGLIGLLMAATAVTAQYHTPQTSDYSLYLPLVARTSAARIVDFRVEPQAADPGQTVTLSWEVQNADRVMLTRFWDFRAAEWWEDLPLIGAHEHTIPDWERNPITFMLTAFSNATGDHVTASLSIYVICPDTWFFSPAPDGCPSAPLYSPAAEQPFEHGVMIWVGAQDRIIVLSADNQYPRVENFTDTWDGGPICDLGPPPAGMVHPMRGFGHIWCENERVRDRLGWALEPEVGFETILQTTTKVKYNHTYLRAADGDVWHLLPESSGWEKIIVDP
jgi:hypothetical protein